MLSHQESILVLGAGELGIAVLRGLAQHRERGSVKLSVLLRPATISSNDAEKRAQIASIQHLGIELVAGNVMTDSVPKLVHLFKSFTTIIGCTGMSGDAGTQVKLAHAVVEAGVRRYIPWQFGVDYDVIGRSSSQGLFAEQLDVRDLLRAQTGTSWIIVSTGMFMTFLFEDFFGVVNADRTVVRALGSWDNRVTVTTPEDIGNLTAEVVLAAPELGNEVVFVAGDTVSYGQIATTVEQVRGKPVERVLWDLTTLQKDLMESPSDGMKKYRVVFAEGKGVAWNEEVTFNWKRGVETISMEQWASDNLERDNLN